MEKQLNLTDFEYAERRKGTRRDIFLKQMDELLPWQEWVALIEPYYFKNQRGRRAQPIERMLRMLLLRSWYSLSDEGVEDAIYDSYAMKSFMRINFAAGEQVPDATTLCKFRKILNKNGLQNKVFAQMEEVLAQKKLQVTQGILMDAALGAQTSQKHRERKKSPDDQSSFLPED